MVVRVRVDVKLGTGTAQQRIPIEVAEVPCALRPCLRVDSEPRRTGDPPARCEGLCSTCPGAAPAPDPSLAKTRGVSRRRLVELVTVPFDPREIELAAAALDAVLRAIPGPEEEG
jgi:hypothetical protein